MIKADGELSGFFSRPIAATLGVVTLLLWVTPVILTLWRHFRANPNG